MVYLCIACIVLSSIALHGIALHRIAWHCIAFDYLLWYCMVLHRLHSVVQLIWRAGELPGRVRVSHNQLFLADDQRLQIFEDLSNSTKSVKSAKS